MNFSTDRDLLLIEPNVFYDVPYAGQEVVRVSDGVVSNVTVTSVLADFEAAGVEKGSVVLVNRVPHEVVDRTDANTLAISLPRAHTTEAPVPSQDGTDLEIVARTYRQQAALVHDVLLRLVGINPDDGEGLDEDAIVSLSVMAQLEALGTLERIYSAAQALVGDNNHVREKAREYRRRFMQMREQTSVLVDVNGDGHAEERRQLGLLRLQRV